MNKFVEWCDRFEEFFQHHMLAGTIIMLTVSFAIAGVVMAVLALIPAHAHAQDTDNQNKMTVCFEDLNNYFKYRLEHANDTDFKIVFPCPPFDKSKLPEDESNK